MGQIKKYVKLVQKNVIPQGHYEIHQVKRGLRNQDGSGVLAGLTRISKVTGFSKVGDKLVPVEGDLEYRQRSIKEIASSCEEGSLFEQATYLLLFGQMPGSGDLEDFNSMLASQRSLPEDMVRDTIIKHNSRHLMTGLAKAVLSLHGFDEDPDSLGMENQLRQSISLISKFPALIAYLHLCMRDPVLLYEDLPHISGGRGTAANFLQMIRPGKTISDLEINMLDLCLFLHLEHGGGNNSTFTTHVISSSQTDIYSTIAGSLGSLKGPLHGGANVASREMMERLMQTVKDWTDKAKIEKYFSDVLSGQAYDRSGKVYGFGHPVYTLSDPRVVMIKEKALELAKYKGREEEYLLYAFVESLVPKLFQKQLGKGKVISANVDFYSGLVYECLGIPKTLYTPLFAMARIVGWCAHRIEELTSGKRLIRPAYKYV